MALGLRQRSKAKLRSRQTNENVIMLEALRYLNPGSVSRRCHSFVIKIFQVIVYFLDGINIVTVISTLNLRPSHAVRPVLQSSHYAANPNRAW